MGALSFYSLILPGRSTAKVDASVVAATQLATQNEFKIHIFYAASYWLAAKQHCSLHVICRLSMLEYLH